MNNQNPTIVHAHKTLNALDVGVGCSTSYSSCSMFVDAFISINHNADCGKIN